MCQAKLWWHAFPLQPRSRGIATPRCCGPIWQPPRDGLLPFFLLGLQWLNSRVSLLKTDITVLGSQFFWPLGLIMLTRAENFEAEAFKLQWKLKITEGRFDVDCGVESSTTVHAVIGQVGFRALTCSQQMEPMSLRSSTGWDSCLIHCHLVPSRLCVLYKVCA